MKRWGLFLVGLAASIVLTVGLWVVGVPGFFLFLFFPLFFLPLGRRPDAPRRRCPTCGLESLDPAVRFCPRDGGRLL